MVLLPLSIISPMVDPTLPLSTQMIDPELIYISCSCAVSLPTVEFPSLTVGRLTSLWFQTPVLIFPLPQLGFVNFHHIPMLINGVL